MNAPGDWERGDFDLPTLGEPGILASTRRGSTTALLAHGPRAMYTGLYGSPCEIRGPRFSFTHMLTKNMRLQNQPCVSSKSNLSGIFVGMSRWWLSIKARGAFACGIPGHILPKCCSHPYFRRQMANNFVLQKRVRGGPTPANTDPSRVQT